MMNEPRFGSSEYSEQAEELFAQYVTRREAGEELDFEELCAAHEELGDELYGLHADWDNVASLLRRVEGRRRAAAPEPEPRPEPVAAAPAEPEPELEPEPAPEPELATAAAPRRESPLWKLLSSFGLVLALAAGGFALMLSRDNGVLAREKTALTEEKVALASESEEREQRRLDLAGELEATREELADERRKLADETKKLTDEQEKLAAERLDKERIQLAAGQATARAESLSIRLGLAALTREAEAFPPPRPEDLAALEAWLARADALASSAAALDEARTQPSDPEEEDLVALSEALDTFAGEAGPRQRIARRLALLERVLGESTEQDELAWTQAIEAIADRDRIPRYAGLVLEPHFALVPLGPDSATGSWLFADRRTGEVPGRDEQGELLPASQPALLFELLPGSTEADDPVAPFFIATSKLTEAHWEYAGVERDHAELGYSLPTPAQARLAGTDDRPVL